MGNSYSLVEPDISRTEKEKIKEKRESKNYLNLKRKQNTHTHIRSSRSVDKVILYSYPMETAPVSQMSGFKS